MSEHGQKKASRRVKRREASRRMEHYGVSADKVEIKYIQDRGVKIQVVGSDEAALYPSLEAIEVARIVYNAVMESEVKFSGVNFTEAARMIALTSSEQECRLGQLRRVLPVRRSKNGTRPGITGEDPLSSETESQYQWRNGLTKKMLTAQVMQKSVLAIFQTHTYSFGPKFYLYAQKLINSEYSLEETRDIIVGGLKGYERLLSLSKDTGNPRWKPSTWLESSIARTEGWPN